MDIDPDLDRAIRRWYPDANSNITVPLVGETLFSDTQRPSSSAPKMKKIRVRASRHPSIIPNASNIEMFFTRRFIEVLGGVEVAIWVAKEAKLRPIRPPRENIT
jgi:hypothetical protein